MLSEGGQMYGLVNKAVEDLAVQLGGSGLWSAIVEHAGIDKPVFVAMEPYDDAITFRLVESASHLLGLSQDEVLEAFGAHWILYTGREGYGPMLSAMGASLPQFLGNLDAMHSRVALSMPSLRPPSFACEELDEQSLVVRYWSERRGLAPMVTGLLRGLGARFDLDVTVTPTTPRPDGVDHDTFLVRYQPALAGREDPSGTAEKVVAGTPAHE
jgi:hypothetical protein